MWSASRVHSMCIHDERTHSKNLSDSSVDCSLVFVASFQARSSVNQSCPLATVMCCVRENHSFNSVMSLLDKMDRFNIPFSSGDLPTFWVFFNGAMESFSRYLQVELGRRRFAELCTNPTRSQTRLHMEWLVSAVPLKPPLTLIISKTSTCSSWQNDERVDFQSIKLFMH